MNTKHVDVVVVITTGKSDRGMRATIALGWACTALALGKTVSVFLTMDGATWAARGAADGVQVEGFEPIHAYLEQFFSLGGELLVCAPCTKFYCGRRDGQENALIPGVRIAGLSSVVSLAGTQTQVITF
ncbi:MAG: DsrE family protein [Deltaproteobacteria bacterium]|nr:DsrE family protein [Deltaproteobacteria bacterium]